MDSLGARVFPVVAVVAVAMALVLAIVLVRMTQRPRAARRARLVSIAQAMTLQLLTAEDSGDTAAAAGTLSGLTGRTSQIGEKRALVMLGKVTGEQHAALARVLDERGVLAQQVRKLASTNSVTRARAAELLGNAQWAAAGPDLVDLLNDRSSQVRLVAARALGRIGSGVSAGPILAMLSSERSLPAGVAADALVALDVDSVPAIAGGLLAADARTRAVCAVVAGRRQLLDSADRLCALVGEDPEAEVRALAATALGHLGLPSALPTLLHAVAPSEPLPVRLAAIRALGALGSSEAMEPLGALCLDDSPSVVVTAATAIELLGNAGADHLVPLSAEQPGAVSVAGVLDGTRLRGGRQLPPLWAAAAGTARGVRSPGSAVLAPKPLQ